MKALCLLSLFLGGLLSGCASAPGNLQHREAAVAVHGNLEASVARREWTWQRERYVNPNSNPFFDWGSWARPEN